VNTFVLSYLVENEEYGYCSIIKATKNILDKINLENTTFAEITPKERIEQRKWNAIAIREAIVNAIVHNDYTREITPKFEIFPDRLEITSYGSLPEGLSQAEFFSGVSNPRNKELMRVFRDLEMVEHLGSGIPRILKAYPTLTKEGVISAIQFADYQMEGEEVRVGKA
jgi:predicted HTH transcriptional regulator